MDELLSHTDFPPNHLVQAIKASMAAITENHHFELGDLNCLQLLRTTMGTYLACMWATIDYGIHESKILILKFNLKLKEKNMVRWIDNIFGYWSFDIRKNMNCSHWKDFVNSLPFGKLPWTTAKSFKTIVFPNMTVFIEKGRITSSTYQILMNLYLYLPPTSNYPPWIIEAIIYQLLKNYKSLGNIFRKHTPNYS